MQNVKLLVEFIENNGTITMEIMRQLDYYMSFATFENKFNMIMIQVRSGLEEYQTKKDPSFNLSEDKLDDVGMIILNTLLNEIREQRH